MKLLWLWFKTEVKMLNAGYLLSYRIIIKENGWIKELADKRNDYTVRDSKITFI